MSDYKSTLNLPQTSFPMRASLVQKEPEMLKHWEAIDAFTCMCEASGSKGEYTLHDGPPYANGHIHLGHALNKVLKDMIVKSRNMMGEVSRYVPGWDCHGLPIEHKVEQELKAKKKELPANVVRRLCREYATKYINIQREEFKRLGVFGTWDNPYLSMAPEYEAAIAHELADFVSKGAVQRSKKPIHWCASCHTALAEAEVEYADHTSPSIFVRFPLTDAALSERLPEADPSRAYVVIWTTTPWTIPDNMGIALHPEFDYVLVEEAGKQYILAEELLDSCAVKFGWTAPRKLVTFKGVALEGLKARHPFYDRDSLVVLGTHVTLDAGTGAVHTAPGHGREDYEVGLKYGLEIYSPVDDSGRFYDVVPFFGGMNVFDANPKVIEKIAESGNLLGESKITHSYPHCWRCKNPVFFRATTQWFIMMETNNLRARTLEAIRNKVQWIPAWGEERIYNMIENRPDWCISRQRTWGVPILALLCENCGEAWNDPAWMHEISDRFAAHETGCDYWFSAELDEIVPKGLCCPACGEQKWKKETDILDVWFDSGSSWAAVLKKREECSYPADMYLEGSDQHRGWFHSSMLVSMSSQGIPPYKSVLTHGYMVDGEGKKMSKSVGNVVAPQEIVDKYGAEILRLLVSSVDYREDIRYSEEAMNRLVDAYRRIRNTCRYLLGNLYDFAPEDALPYLEMDPLDRFAISLSITAHNRVQDAFRNFEFHKFYHTMHNLCTTDLSAFYLDVLKDRIYSYTPKSRERRSAQTALKIILDLLMRDMAPVLSFTAEEIFRSMPEALRQNVKTVFALPEPDLSVYELSPTEVEAWKKLLDIRAEVTRVIEPMRKEGVIGHALDTHVCIYAEPELKQMLEQLGTDLRALFIVSKLELLPIEKAPEDAYSPEDMHGVLITAAKAPGEKCARCWIYSEDIGKDTSYTDVCPRCACELHKIQG